MTSQDRKYFVVKRLIEGGDITVFYQIFDNIAPTKVAKDLGMHFNTLKRLIKADENWKLKELYRLAGMIGIDEDTIIALILKQRAEKKSKRTKKQP